MAIAYSEIARVLDGARRRQGWIVLGTALGAGAAAALVVLAGGAALLGTGLGPPHAVRAATLAGAALVLLCALFWAAAALLRRASSPAAVARSLGEARPELESDLLSSVELEGEYEALQRSGRYSVALVDAHIARTAERTRGLALAEVIPATPARRALSALAVVVFANLVAVAAAPRVLGQGWQRLAGLGPTVPVRRAEPITGDVEVTYVYPAYMKREPKTLSGTGGELSAPKGTAVTLKTRADREVQRGEIALENAEGGTAAPSSDVAADRRAGARPPPPEATAGSQVFELTVRNSRDLEAHLTLDAPGAYRFRYFHGKKLVAEGPAIPIAVEVDAAPEIRITAPAPEIEVDARARVRVEWTASDDVGLEKLTLVTKPPEGEERRAELKSFAGTRRESGVHELELAPLRLAEGEKLLYRLEVQDGDVVSGPKKGTSATHTIKIYSEAEHHRAALLRAQALWEDMVKLLGDRLEFFDGGARWSDERVARAQGFDGRTRTLHEGLRGAAQELRKDRSAPRQLPQALANVAAALRPLEEDLASLRLTLARMLHFQRGGASTLFDRVAEVDGRLDRELEKDILYLEQLFDQQRADDLVKVAKDLAARRRDLARLLEDYKKAPTDAARKELLAEVSRMKARMAEMLRRMGELAKGINDEHMNREALAEMARSKDAMGGLDEVEKKLAQGDLEGAMKALDQLGNAMQDMLASLERTAGRPGEQNAALMKDMLAFKKELEDVKAEQENVARDTDQVKGEYQKRLAQKLKQLEAGTKQLEGLAKDARRELERSEPGVSSRSEDEYGQARERLGDLQKALAARDLDAALETVKRALPPMQRLAMDIGDEAAMAERYRALRSKDPDTLREAQRHAAAALGPARKVRDELERMFPDPRQVLGPKEQDRLSQLSEQQGKLERRAGELRQKLSELSQRAPVFPPQAQEMLGGSQGHMERAQGELAQKNPQRGHGEQRQALDDLGRFQRGLDEMAKNSKRGQGGGGGFPFPFGEEQGGREGDGTDPSQEKVEIPGADAFKAPDEFRKDLLEAMKQGTPEPYQGEVKRYYEELVK